MVGAAASIDGGRAGGDCRPRLGRRPAAVGGSSGRSAGACRRRLADEMIHTQVECVDGAPSALSYAQWAALLVACALLYLVRLLACEMGSCWEQALRILQEMPRR